MSGEKTTFLTSKQRRKIRNNLTGYAFIIPNLVGYTECYELGRLPEAHGVCGTRKLC